MSNSNSGFIATIVEQSQSSGKAQLNNDAPTIIEKYKTPRIKSMDRMMGIKEEMEDDVDEEEMSDLSEGDFCPELYLNDKQLPSADGLVVGDKICLKIEAEVSRFEYTENENGMKRQSYTFKLKKGIVKKEVE